MTARPVTGDLEAQTHVEVVDSCNCCWGRKIKHKPAYNRSNAKMDLFAAGSPKLVRDANSVYNLGDIVPSDSPHEGSEKKHIRQQTKYPHDSSYDAGSTQSTQSDHKEKK